MTEYWYRFEDVKYAGPVNEFGELDGPGHVELRLLSFKVRRETPRGVQLDMGCSIRFVSRTTHKRFACPTIAEAAESFRARKHRQRKIHQAWIDRVNVALSLLDLALAKIPLDVS